LPSEKLHKARTENFSVTGAPMSKRNN